MTARSCITSSSSSASGSGVGGGHGDNSGSVSCDSPTICLLASPCVWARRACLLSTNQPFWIECKNGAFDDDGNLILHTDSAVTCRIVMVSVFRNWLANAPGSPGVPRDPQWPLVILRPGPSSSISWISKGCCTCILAHFWLPAPAVNTHGVLLRGGALYNWPMQVPMQKLLCRRVSVDSVLTVPRHSPELLRSPASGAAGVQST